MSSAVLLHLPTFSRTTTTPSHTAGGSIAAATAPLLPVNAQQLHSPSYPQTIPPKVVKKILSLEYVDMAELLPEYWDYDEPEPHCCGSHSSRGTRRNPVANILVWLDCYASLVAVLCSVYPNKAGEFMAYQKTIITAYRKYAGDGWIIYDSSFRRKAANLKSLDWGQMDGKLYNETFTGRAKAIARCRICSSELHSHTECPQATDRQQPAAHTAAWQIPPDRIELCMLFNDQRGDRCHFVPCKFTHLCSQCRGSHPRSRCPSTRRDQPYSRKGDHRQASGRRRY